MSYRNANKHHRSHSLAVLSIKSFPYAIVETGVYFISVLNSFNNTLLRKGLFCNLKPAPQTKFPVDFSYYRQYVFLNNDFIQPAFTCSNLTTETLASFRYLYCQLWTYFTPCSSVSIVNFEQINGGWGWKMRKASYKNRTNLR